MEDVLEIYHRPQDRANPVVCVDETSQQHIKETGSLCLAEGIVDMIINTPAMALAICS